MGPRWCVSSRVRVVMRCGRSTGKRMRKHSRFCDLFCELRRRLSLVMREHHVAGDKLFADYSGKKIGIIDSATVEVRVVGVSGRATAPTPRRRGHRGYRIGSERMCKYQSSGTYPVKYASQNTQSTIRASSDPLRQLLKAGAGNRGRDKRKVVAD